MEVLFDQTEKDGPLQDVPDGRHFCMTTTNQYGSLIRSNWEGWSITGCARRQTLLHDKAKRLWIQSYCIQKSLHIALARLRRSTHKSSLESATIFFFQNVQWGKGRRMLMIMVENDAVKNNWNSYHASNYDNQYGIPNGVNATSGVWFLLIFVENIFI
jgi:hypothetical protein